MGMTNSASVPKIFSTLLARRWIIIIINVIIDDSSSSKTSSSSFSKLISDPFWLNHLFLDYRPLLVGMVKKLSFRPVTRLHETAGNKSCHHHLFLPFLLLLKRLEVAISSQSHVTYLPIYNVQLEFYDLRLFMVYTYFYTWLFTSGLDLKYLKYQQSVSRWDANSPLSIYTLWSSEEHCWCI